MLMKRTEFFFRMICFLLAALLAAASFPAFAERASWDCPDCGRTGNTGNFCGGCGRPAPRTDAEEDEDAWPDEEYETDPEDDGGLGAGIRWEISGGVLRISGQGPMGEFSFSDDAPWCSEAEEIREAVIERGVTTISDYAFYSFTSLDSVTIPDTVVSIGDLSFCSCESLTGIVIPGSVARIGDYAFMGCESLTDVSIQEGVAEIGDNAFTYCDALIRVSIPGSVTRIEDRAFFEQLSEWVDSGELPVTA